MSSTNYVIIQEDVDGQKRILNVKEIDYDWLSDTKIITVENLNIGIDNDKPGD